MVFLRTKQRAFTLIELLVVVGLIIIALALLLPTLRSAREPARRNGCMSNLHNLGLALHGHHGVRNYLPALTSTDIMEAVPGLAEGSTDASTDAAGYSWLVRILPFMEETA